MAAARQLFADQGYAHTNREEVAERAGVTRGALYHHFDSKADLFAAVVRALDDEIAARVVSASAGAGSVAETIDRAAAAYLDVCSSAQVARIMTDAQSVLGPTQLRQLSSESCLSLLTAALTRAAGEGAAVPGDPAVAAQLLLGTLNEAALLAASTPGRGVPEPVSRTLREFLARLLAPPGPPWRGRR
ncbi:MAG TPA: helix-turn-helix domain-containing protein [Acidimicrobiales bacterium]|nr:helix-turn-helix domain-containing protein [Acidimicrobiales bacterium]